MKEITLSPSKEQVEEINQIISNVEWYRQAAHSEWIYIAIASLGALHELPYPSVFCKEKEYEGYYDVEGLKEESKTIFSNAKKSTNEIDSYFKKFKTIKEKVSLILTELATIKVNSSLFIKKVEELNEFSFEMWSHCFLVDKLDMEGANLIKQEADKYNLSEEDLNTLIRPHQRNFIENSTLSLAKNIKNGTPSLQEIAKQFYFIHNSWGSVKILTEKDFQEMIPTLELTNERINFLENLEEIQKNKCQNIDVPKEMRNLAHLFRTLFRIRDERKEIVLKTNHFNELLVQNRAKKHSLSPELLRNAFPKELVHFNKDLIPLLEKRKKACLIFGYGDEQPALVLSGDDALTNIKKLHNQLLAKTDQIKGRVACNGNVKTIKGTAKVILGETHFTKFKDNDILVAPMTRPEYVPLMKKAKAIVTDEGGITCHAAIVSRELNIPCIIGTKVATKKIFDGRDVTLNLETGEIKNEL